MVEPCGGNSNFGVTFRDDHTDCVCVCVSWTVLWVTWFLEMAGICCWILCCRRQATRPTQSSWCFVAMSVIRGMFMNHFQIMSFEICSTLTCKWICGGRRWEFAFNVCRHAPWFASPWCGVDVDCQVIAIIGNKGDRYKGNRKRIKVHQLFVIMLS